MRNFISPHCHIQSLDTGSAPESFADREIELGTGYITTTDHGSMGVCRSVYDLAKKKKLTPILGLEAYFRDDNCPILKAGGIENIHEYNKYYHFTLHFLDQEAYETGARILSNAPLDHYKTGGEAKPIFNWRDVEELGSKNIVITSGCLIGIVQRHLHPGHDPLARRPDLGEAYYKRFRELTKPGNFYVEVFPHRCTHYFESGVYVTLEGEEAPRQLRSWKTLLTNVGKLKADALDREFNRKDNKHEMLLAVMHDRKFVEEPIPRKILKVEKKEGFIQNECTIWTPDGDLQHGTNAYVMELAKKYGDPIIISDDAHFAKADDKVVQDIRLNAQGNWRFANSYHRMSTEEAAEYFKQYQGVSEKEIERWVDNAYGWAERFKGFTLKTRQTLPTSFYPDNTLKYTQDLIKKHGRMNWDDRKYVARLRSEINLLHYNKTVDLLPYFFIDEEVCYLHEQHELLTGPGRGSAAGLLLTYLLGITHVDPIRYNLSQDRFLTLDRIKTGKYPDIDQDLPHRLLLVGEDGKSGWLKERFGNCFAQISVDTTLRLKSSIKDVARVNHEGKVPEEIEKLCHKIPTPPQGITDRDYTFGYKGSDGHWVPGAVETEPALQEYMGRYPKEWEVVKKCLGIVRQKGRHACAYVIANEPIENLMPTTLISDIRCTQYPAPSVEASGGLKMDFLVLNSLKDIGDCIKLIQERHGNGRDFTLPFDIDGKRVPAFRVVSHGYGVYDIWDLPEDQAVFREICEGSTETVFQFNTPGARGWLEQFNEEIGNGKKAINSIEDLAAFTALDRPGPLDAYVTDGVDKHNMLVEYANRAKGRPRIGALPVLDKLLPETYGIIVYQEQLQRVFQEVGQTTAIEANNFREHISKKKMAEVIKDKEIFMKGAVSTLGEQQATELWDSLETFGRYGFNRSHAICYVVIGYACAWLKHHYPLEWWTAVLRNADRNEIIEKFWRHCGSMIDMPDIALSGPRFEIKNERIRAPLSLLYGIGPKAQEEINAILPVSTVEEMCQKIYARRVSLAKPAKSKDGTPKLDKQGRPLMKLATSALKKDVISTLIISGAMDGLFPSEASMLDQLKQYRVAKGEVEGKEPDPVDPRYIDLSEVVRFQMKKSILPAYSPPLLPMVVRAGTPKIQQINNIWTYTAGQNNVNKYATIANLKQAEYLLSVDMLEQLEFAIVAYVVQDERRTYQGNKEMAKIVLDVEGTQWELVHWPPYRGKKLPPHMNKPLTGAVVLAVLSKYKADRPFSITHIDVLFPPLGTAESEESPEPQEK